MSDKENQKGIDHHLIFLIIFRLVTNAISFVICHVFFAGLLNEHLNARSLEYRDE